MLRAACGALLVLAGIAQGSPERAVATAYIDAARYRPKYDTEYLRYFWVDRVGADLVQFRAAFRLLLNSLSRESEMGMIHEVKPWLWRIDIRDFGLPWRVLEKAADIDPFFHVRKGKQTYHAPWLVGDQIRALSRLTRSNVPVLHAGWWLAQTSRQVALNGKQTGLGYYDVLGVKNQDDYFRLIGLDEKTSIRIQREVRAALEHSGISQHWRQIVRLQGATGGVWITLDSDGNGTAPAIEALRRGEFKEKAREIIGPIPNGLPSSLLSDNKGALQDSAPDFIGPDDSPLRVGSGCRDGRIHTFISCWSCHAKDVLKPIDDHVRKVFTGKPLKLASTKREITLELRRQYLTNLDRWLLRDRLEYWDAIRQATVTSDYPLGLDAGTASKVLLGAYHEYVTQPVTLARAARELGTTAKNWHGAMHSYGHVLRKIDPTLGTFLIEGGTLSRLTWERSYPKAQLILRGLIEVKP